MALTKVSTGVVDMSGNTGGLIIAKGNGTDVSSGGERPTCNAANLGSIRENTDENKVEVCTSTGWRFLEEAGPSFVSLTVDYLVVAGGGGGGGCSNSGYLSGAGGGAGGMRTSFGTGNVNGGLTPVESTLTLTPATSYSITVGSGGAGMIDSFTQTAYGNQGVKGDDSVFHTITSTGGGGGGAMGATPYQSASSKGGVGGSGGGSGFRNGPTGTGSAATPYGVTPAQGFVGGSSGPPYSPGYATGGGGGAGGAGGAGGPNPANGPGGLGLENAITGTPTFYAGGGGGSTYRNQYAAPGPGGSGIGGDGGGSYIYVAGIGGAGAANTGSGGGGGNAGSGAYSKAGGAGGSGVVILRFPISYSAPIETNISPAGGLTTSVSVDGSYRVVTYTCTTNATVSATLTF
jgi:hypothetical protein